jgi:hypothetical protein
MNEALGSAFRIFIANVPPWVRCASSEMTITFSRFVISCSKLNL